MQYYQYSLILPYFFVDNLLTITHISDNKLFCLDVSIWLTPYFSFLPSLPIIISDHGCFLKPEKLAKKPYLLGARIKVYCFGYL